MHNHDKDASSVDSRNIRMGIAADAVTVNRGLVWDSDLSIPSSKCSATL